MAEHTGELAAVDECTCGHLWDQHYAAAGRQGFCLSHCGCRGFIGVGRKSAVHLAAGRPEMPDHDDFAQHPYADLGRFLFRCEAGHNIVQDAPDLDRCPAMLPWPSDDAKPCGADIKYRVIPYVDISGSPKEGPDGR